MVTPALTKQQQKKALSGKKTQNILRNVLSSPYDTYWPLLREKDEEFNSTLESLFAPLRVDKWCVSFPRGRHLSWQEINKYRKANWKLPEQTKVLRELVLTGVNVVVKGLEKDTLCCVLLAADAEPRDLVRHVVVMCANRKVPVLVVPNFSEMFLHSVGYSTIACGFKKCVAEDKHNHFHELFRMVTKRSAEFPIPEPAPLFHEASQVSEDKTSDDEEKHRPTEPAGTPSDLYLRRSSTKERVFVPGAVPTADLAAAGDFVALGTDMEVVSEEGSEPAGISQWARATDQVHRPHYIAPVIKRLQSNPNKKKNKKKKNKNKD